MASSTKVIIRVLIRGEKPSHIKRITSASKKPAPIDLTDFNKALELRGDKIPDPEPTSWENLPGGLPPTRWV